MAKSGNRYTNGVDNGRFGNCDAGAMVIAAVCELGRKASASLEELDSRYPVAVYLPIRIHE